MMPVEPQLLSAVRLVTEDQQCRGIFDAILRAGGKASGWSVTKMLDQNPQAVEAGLGKMRAHNIVESTGGPGLEGYYYLTPLGFQVRSTMLK